uniref:RNase III domain-containing protein n=1 Tax=Tetradesmus obliquus TaxID=3088 RepID=A0A383V3C2_TETOB|eukprot:jgi/Sobl393_1/4547/SZX59433.1
MLSINFRLTGNAACPFDHSNTYAHRALLRPTVGRASAAEAVRCRCTAEPQPQPPAAAAAADEPGANAADRLADAAGVSSAALNLPAAPQLLGASPQGRWNAVSLAFLGDSVWEAVLRAHYYDPANMRQYGARVAASATTQAQAAVYQLLVNGSWLRAEEASLLRWASNSASVAPPPHASRQQYKQATAVEALVAHLYLTDAARLQQLMEWLLQPQRLKKWQQPLPAQAQQPASATRKGSAGRQARGSTKPVSAATKGSQKGGSDAGSSAAGHVDIGAGGRRVRGAGASKQSTAGA